MREKKIYMVQAVRENELVEDFLSGSFVAIGSREDPDVTKLSSLKEFRQEFGKAYPELQRFRLSLIAGFFYRFIKEMKVGDYVISYDKKAREYIAGEVESDARYEPKKTGGNYPFVRDVKWIGKFSRDSLSPEAKKSLSSWLTVFKIDKRFAEIEALIKGEKPDAPPHPDDFVPYYEEVKEKADELISDCLSKIDPFDFQELVAAVLRAMGYRTVVSARGPDSGVDIIAHRDALGFESPKIKVQVKHRVASASGPDIRNFVATLREGEKGLFVSTGGFTKDGKIEAEKAIRPLTVLDRDRFIDLLIEYYEKLEPEYKALVPLRKVYIPVEA